MSDPERARALLWPFLLVTGGLSGILWILSTGLRERAQKHFKVKRIRRILCPDCLLDNVSAALLGYQQEPALAQRLYWCRTESCARVFDEAEAKWVQRGRYVERRRP